MPNSDEDALLNEAADVFVRLREDPDDQAAVKDRVAFLSKGPDAEKALATIERAWMVGGGSKRKPPILPMIAFLVTGLAGYLLWPEARTAWLADVASGRSTEQLELTSGDLAILDASTSLVDQISPTERQIEVLEGAVFFEVNADQRPFRVIAGQMSVEAVGTAFEVAFVDDETVVTMEEGRVIVERADESWTLVEGQRLSWSERDGGRIASLNTQAVATWRSDVLDLDGLTLGQAIAIIDRRIPGSVVISNEALAQSEVSGSVNLTNPRSALRAIAAARGARVFPAYPIGALVVGGN
ncbi:MAG: FecR domain-containing protein [Pseudomonadota bacterium]